MNRWRLQVLTVAVTLASYRWAGAQGAQELEAEYALCLEVNRPFVQAAKGNVDFYNSVADESFGREEKLERVVQHLHRLRSARASFHVALNDSAESFKRLPAEHRLYLYRELVRTEAFPQDILARYREGLALEGDLEAKDDAEILGGHAHSRQAEEPRLGGGDPAKYLAFCYDHILWGILASGRMVKEADRRMSSTLDMLAGRRDYAVILRAAVDVPIVLGDKAYGFSGATPGWTRTADSLSRLKTHSFKAASARVKSAVAFGENMVK